MVGEKQEMEGRPKSKLRGAGEYYQLECFEALESGVVRKVRRKRLKLANSH